MRAELQVKGNRRGGVYEPSDARWDPLQLLGALQRVRSRRVSGTSLLKLHATPTQALDIKKQKTEKLYLNYAFCFSLIK